MARDRAIYVSRVEKKSGDRRKANKYTKLMERIDAALQKRGEEYLDAVRRSILEDIIIEKTHVKRLPDGTEIKGDPQGNPAPRCQGCVLVAVERDSIHSPVLSRSRWNVRGIGGRGGERAEETVEGLLFSQIALCPI